MKRLLSLLILMGIFYMPLQLFGQTTPYRIRMPDSTYSAKLVGTTGTRTAGLTVSGTWSSYYRMHEFNVTTSGRYQLYVDAAGGASYTLVSTWGKTYGKYVPGYDEYEWMEKLNSSEQVMSIGIGDTAVSTDHIKYETILQNDLADSQVSLRKMTTAAVNYIGSGGLVTNNPDDVTLENKSGSTLGINDPWINKIYDIKYAADTTALKAIFSADTTTRTAYLKQLSATNTDGGGWFYRIDSTYTEGVIAFDCDSSGLQWVRQDWINTKTVNVLWGGATSDATENDSTAFYKCFAIANTDSGSIFIPNGTYHTGKLAYSFTNPVKIYGGPDVTLYGDQDAFVFINAADHIQVSNIKFQNYGVALGGSAIDGSGNDDIVVRINNCEFFKCNDPINWGTPWDSGDSSATEELKLFEVKDCVIDSCNYGITLCYYFCDRTIITDNVITNLYQTNSITSTSSFGINLVRYLAAILVGDGYEGNGSKTLETRGVHLIANNIIKSVQNNAVLPTPLNTASYGIYAFKHNQSIINNHIEGIACPYGTCSGVYVYGGAATSGTNKDYSMCTLIQNNKFVNPIRSRSPGGGIFSKGDRNYDNGASREIIKENTIVFSDSFDTWASQTLNSSHTGASSQTTICSNGSATWTDDQYIGKCIYNYTDGSYGVITDNSDTTITVAAGLFRGTDNDFDNGDSLIITADISYAISIQCHSDPIIINNYIEGSNYGLYLPAVEADGGGLEEFTVDVLNNSFYKNRTRAITSQSETFISTYDNNLIRNCGQGISLSKYTSGDTTDYSLIIKNNKILDCTNPNMIISYMPKYLYITDNTILNVDTSLVGALSGANYIISIYPLVSGGHFNSEIYFERNIVHVDWPKSISGALYNWGFHYTGSATYGKADKIIFRDNSIGGMNDAIKITKVDTLIVENNEFKDIADAYSAAVSIDTTDFDVWVWNNNRAMDDLTFFRTENEGVATISSGDDSVIVTHGIGASLKATNLLVQVTPVDSMGQATQFWIKTGVAYGGTTFTIKVNAASGGDTRYFWKAKAAWIKP